MSKKRRQHSAQYKFQIAVEAARAEKTVSQIASEHNIHPNQVSQWKRQLLESGPEVDVAVRAVQVSCECEGERQCGSSLGNLDGDCGRVSARVRHHAFRVRCLPASGCPITSAVE
jgi:transposase-like protein